MKKIFVWFMLILFFGLSTVYSEISKEASIPVEFTAEERVNVGISKNMVIGTLKPETDYTEIHFTPSTDFLSYTTGTFYIYIQSFTPKPLTVYIKAPSLVNETSSTSVEYTNNGSNTKEFEKSSNESIKILTTEGINEPTTYNLALNLNIPINEETMFADDKYTQTVTVTVEWN